jgi:hypothetical protein
LVTILAEVINKALATCFSIPSRPSVPRGHNLHTWPGCLSRRRSRPKWTFDRGRLSVVAGAPPAGAAADLAWPVPGWHDGSVTDGWRREADAAFLAARRSAMFKRRRSALGRALSDAELGPFGGSRRNPALKLSDKAYAHVRYALREYSYAVIQVDLLVCRRCGKRLLEEHRMLLRRRDGDTITLGWVRMCRQCQKDAWLFTSHMPTVRAAAVKEAKVVL